MNIDIQNPLSIVSFGYFGNFQTIDHLINHLL